MTWEVVLLVVIADKIGALPTISQPLLIGGIALYGLVRIGWAWLGGEFDRDQP